MTQAMASPASDWNTTASKWCTNTSKQENNANSSKVSKEPVGNTLYYNGTKQQLIKSGGAFKDSKKNPMYYSLNGYTWTSDISKITGKEVGKYTIMYGSKVGGRYIKAGTFTAEIREKAPAIISMPVAKTGLIYDGYNHNLLLFSGKLSEGQMYYKLDTGFDCGSCWSKKTTWTKNYYEIVGKAVGKYKIKIGYMDSDGEIKEFIGKYVVADISFPKVAKEPEGSTPDYTGEYQKLIKTPGRFKEYKTYTMYYSLDGFNWTSDVSKIKGKDEKNYTIYYGYKFGNRYITVGKLNVCIEKKPTLESAPASVGTLVNTGEEQQLLTSGGTLSEGVMYYRLGTDGVWTTDYTKITAKDNGEYTVYLGYKSNATGKVVAFEGETVTATIEPKLIDAPTAKNLSYTGEAQELVEPGSYEGTEMYYKVGDGEASTTVPKATESDDYTVKYGYMLKGEFIEKGEVKASIKEVPTVTLPPEAIYDLRYNPLSSQELVTAGTLSEGDMYYRYKKSADPDTEFSTPGKDIPKVKNVGTYVVEYGYDDSGTFVKLGSVVAAIEERFITNEGITMSVSPDTYNEDDQQHTPTVTVKDGEVKLIEGTDYYLTGETTSAESGNHDITVHGMGNYTGSNTVSWYIFPKYIP